MVVITDGNGGDPKPEADAARAEETIVFAVGVGEEEKTVDISITVEPAIHVAVLPNQTT